MTSTSKTKITVRWDKLKDRQHLQIVFKTGTAKFIKQQFQGIGTRNGCGYCLAQFVAGARFFRFFAIAGRHFRSKIRSRSPEVSQFRNQVSGDLSICVSYAIFFTGEFRFRSASLPRNFHKPGNSFG